MRIAHLVLCHKNPQQVIRLVSRMAGPECDFYVHLDMHADIAPWRPLAAMPSVFFIKDRLRTHWAGYSIVRATLNGFRQILSSGRKYGCINLLSGQDYPLKPPGEIHSFYAENSGKAFMIAEPFTGRESELERIMTHHFVHLRFRGRYTAERIANAVAPQRMFSPDFIPVGKCQWMSMPPECAGYILGYFACTPHITRLFHYMWAPDEIVFQSVLYNSHFRKIIVNDNQRYIDWTEGKPNPKILTMADAAQLAASDKLFARKFDVDADSKILDYLDERNGWRG